MMLDENAVRQLMRAVAQILVLKSRGDFGALGAIFPTPKFIDCFGGEAEDRPLYFAIALLVTTNRGEAEAMMEDLRQYTKRVLGIKIRREWRGKAGPFSAR